MAPLSRPVQALVARRPPPLTDPRSHQALVWLSQLLSTSRDDLTDMLCGALSRFDAPPLPDSGCGAPLITRIGPDQAGGVVLVCDLSELGGEAVLRTQERQLIASGISGAAACLAALLGHVSQMEQVLARPIWLVLHHGGEAEAKTAVHTLRRVAPRPGLVLSAQPTGMVPVADHPGRCRFRAHSFGSRGRGLATWSGANAAEALIRYAGRLLELRSELMLRGGQAGLAISDMQSEPGGDARPHGATLDWALEYHAAADLAFVLDALEGLVHDTLVPQMQALDPSANIVLEKLSDLPPLRPAPLDDTRFYRLFRRPPVHMRIHGAGGIWQMLGAPVVTIGPGASDAPFHSQERISLREFAACLALMDRIEAALSE